MFCFFFFFFFQAEDGIRDLTVTGVQTCALPIFAVVLAPEEVVEADLVQAGRAGVGGDVPAHTHARAVLAGDHDRGVPPDVGPDPPLDVLVAGEPRLTLGRDRVDVVGTAQAGHPDLLLARPLEQAEHDVPGAGPASGAHDRIERLDPFARLVRVDVGQLGRQPVADDGELLTSGSHGVASPSACGSGGRSAACTDPSMCCPDQSSYELADRASLLDGNRTRGTPRTARSSAGPGRPGWGPFSPWADLRVTLRD